jgi:predicted dehydrogenase
MAEPRLGFVGLGWIGAMRLEALAEAGAAQVVALCDTAPERLERAAAAHPAARVFGEFDALLAAAAQLRLDGVVLATPNALHAEQASAALEHGLAVFCQKPLGLDAQETRRIVAAARVAGRLLDVDFSYRHAETATTLRRMVAAGALGRVFHIETVFHNAYGPDKAWYHDPRLAGGGALMDLGVHMVDLALWLVGSTGVARVDGQALKQGEPAGAGTVDDFASARLVLDSGAVANLAVSWHAHAGRDCVIRVTLFGTAGGAELRNTAGSFYDLELLRFDGRTERLVCTESRDWLGRATLDWAGRLARSPAYDPAIESAITVAEVLDGIYGRVPVPVAL